MKYYVIRSYVINNLNNYDYGYHIKEDELSGTHREG
jgi:hypothetical protein